MRSSLEVTTCSVFEVQIYHERSEYIYMMKMVDVLDMVDLMDTVVMMDSYRLETNLFLCPFSAV